MAGRQGERSPRTAAKPKKGGGPKGCVRELIDDGFFKKPKTIAEVKAELANRGAHGRYYHARREDIEGLRPGCRIVIEEFLHHAGLL
jgi:hypothetical protein